MKKVKDQILNQRLDIYHLLVLQILPWKLSKKSIRLLIAKSKVVNRKTKQGLDSFFIADCQLKPEIEISDLKNTLSCLQKGTSNETVGISGETPSLVGCNIQGFATRLVAIKAFFMNAIFELKQEIESFPRDKEILG